MASRDELADELVLNEYPGIPRITVRPEGVRAPPIVDDPYQSAPLPAGPGSMEGGPQPPWGEPAQAAAGGWGSPEVSTGRPSMRLFEPDQTPAPVKPQWQPGMLSLVPLARGFGNIVQGARDSFNAPAPPPPQPRAPVDPTAGPRQMFQQGYRGQPPSQPGLVGGLLGEALQAPQNMFSDINVERHPASTPEQVEQAKRQLVGTAAETAMNIAGPGLVTAAARPGASAGLFGGRLSPMADQKAFDLAERMQARGASEGHIRNVTGLTLFPDKKFRFEVSDKEAYYKGIPNAYDPEKVAKNIFLQTNPNATEKDFGSSLYRLSTLAARQVAEQRIASLPPLKWSDLMHHPEAEKAFPYLKDMPVEIDRTMHGLGAYGPPNKRGQGTGIFKLRPTDDDPRGQTFKVLLHEPMHKIQDVERFALGGNPDFIPLNSPAYKIYQDKVSQLRAQNIPISPEAEQAAYSAAGREHYRRLAGEKEADVVMDRADLTSEQRAAINPVSQMRVKPKDQIIDFGDPEQLPLLSGGRGQIGDVLNPTPREMQMSADPSRLQRPSGLATDRQTAGYSNIKGGTSVENMNWRIKHGPPTETRTSMPIDKALRPGDEVIPIVGDETRKLQQGYVTEIGGQPVSPVLQQGGFDFALDQPVDPRTGLRDIWGNAQGAATQIDNLARAAEARGNRPVIVSTTMKKTGGDFSPQLYDPTIELLKRNPPDEKLAAILDTFMRTKNNAGAAYTPEQFPGFASPEVWKVLENAPGTMRAKIMKALDRKAVVDAGGPDVGLIRVSQSNPDLYNTPSGYMGYHIADVAPGQTGRAAHSAFPIATRGSNVRGLGGSVPGELMLPELAKGLEEMYRRTKRPEYLNQMDYYAIRVPNEAAINLGMKPLPRTQVITKQMIDAIGEWVHKHGLKSLPPAVATLYLANSGGEAKAAPVGSVVDPSRYNAQ